MKNHFFYWIFLYLLGGFINEISAQKSIGIPPFSSSEEFKQVQTTIPILELAPPDMQKILEEDLSFWLE